MACRFKWDTKDVGLKMTFFVTAFDIGTQTLFSQAVQSQQHRVCGSVTAGFTWTE